MKWSINSYFNVLEGVPELFVSFVIASLSTFKPQDQFHCLLNVLERNKECYLGHIHFICMLCPVKYATIVSLNILQLMPTCFSAPLCS